MQKDTTKYANMYIKKNYAELSDGIVTISSVEDVFLSVETVREYSDDLGSDFVVGDVYIRLDSKYDIYERRLVLSLYKLIIIIVYMDYQIFWEMWGDSMDLLL